MTLKLKDPCDDLLIFFINSLPSW